MKAFTKVLLYFCLSGSCIAQPRFVQDSLDAFITRGMKQWKIPGLSIAIVKDSKVALTRGYGVLEIGKSEKVNENTLFAIGSNTKAFTGTAAVLLDDERKLSLDDKIKKWLPDFRLYDTVATEQATIRDFLCHRAGLGECNGDLIGWNSVYPPREIFSRMRFIKPQFAFRTKFGYCNMGYLLTGEIVAISTGRSWNDYIRERILVPLGMNRTLTTYAEIAKSTNVAAPHMQKNTEIIVIPRPNLDNMAPAGAIYSSALEMAQWVTMQLDTGKLNGKQIVPTNVILETWKPQMIDEDWGSDLLEPSTHLFAYGLGWGLKDYAGRKVIRHTGGVDGFYSAVTFVPEERLGIVVLTNGMRHKFHAAVTHQLLDAYLNNRYKDWSQILFHQFAENNAKKEREWKMKMGEVTPQKATSLPFHAFAGHYENQLYGTISAVIEGKNLVLHFSAHPSLLGYLTSLRADVFYCKYSNPVFGECLVSYKVDDDKVLSLTLYVHPWVDPLEYKFRKIVN